MRARTLPLMVWPLLPVVLAWLAGARAVPAQSPPGGGLAAQPHVALPYPLLFGNDADAEPAPRASRPGPACMPSGFLNASLGIMERPAEPIVEAAPIQGGDDFEGLSILQVNFGSYNPYFELRRPGDPGGVGFFKLASQLSLLEQGSTSVSLGLNALTPAGSQFGGAASGQTTVTPALAWTHDLGAGTALQGYVGQNIQANARWTESLFTNLQCGMSLQCPVPGTAPSREQGAFFFLQALGSYDTARPDGRPSLWEVVPGVHYRWSSSCWMSVGVSRYNFLTASWQF